ncbi:50S ribosomal protein L3 [Buchnera aphidicola (Chaitoregma tattakana)]|uniref:50S ribosomal protein L3 n=1 Tax=Buchnera aphidicola TaxID=9 RepID=UPI0031B82AA1
MVGLVGKKVGASMIFLENGDLVPVTVIKITKNRIVQIKNLKNDFYSAIQVTTGERNINKINKPTAGHFIKHNVLAGRGLWEFRVPDTKNFSVGQSISINIFKNISMVDVTGFSKGKGFSGTIKRWNFKSQDSSHGNSLSHRAPGSIGQNQTPGRVFKGKKMSGHLGNNRVTIQNLKIVSIDNNNFLFVKGTVPGPSNGDVIVRPSIKTRGKKIS